MCASGWVSSLSESSLTKSCQLSNCQWAIWVTQHLSEEFSLSTHQGENTFNTIGLTKKQQFFKVGRNWSCGWIKGRVLSCALLNFPGTPSTIGNGPNSFTRQTAPLPNYLASSLVPPLPALPFSSAMLDTPSTCTSALWTPKLCKCCALSLLPPPQLIQLLHSDSSFYTKLGRELLQEAFPPHHLYHHSQAGLQGPVSCSHSPWVSSIHFNAHDSHHLCMSPFSSLDCTQPDGRRSS